MALPRGSLSPSASGQLPPVTGTPTSKQPATPSTDAATRPSAVPDSGNAAADAGGPHAPVLFPRTRGARPAGKRSSRAPGSCGAAPPALVYLLSRGELAVGWGGGNDAASVEPVSGLTAWPCRATPLCPPPHGGGGEPMSRAWPRAPATHQGESGPGGL